MLNDSIPLAHRPFQRRVVHGIRRHHGTVFAQQSLHLLAFFAVIELDDGQARARRVHPGVGIGTAFEQQFRCLQMVARASLEECPAARRVFFGLIGIGTQLQQFFDDLGMAVASGIGQRTAPSGIESAGLSRIGCQHRIDAISIASRTGNAQSVLRAASEQMARDNPRISRRFRRQIARPKPVVAVERDQQRRLAIGAASFEVGTLCDKEIHQVVLPRQRRPVQRPIAQRIGGADKVGMLGQHRLDLRPVAAFDRLGQRDKTRIVAKALAQRRHQQRLHFP